MRIAIDIDSTLHHYWDQFREVVRRRHGVDLPYDEQHTWGVTQLPHEDVFACIQETHTPEFVRAAQPYPGAVEAVRRWREAGHFIHITSHRAVDSYAHTKEWLDAIGLPYDELYCSYDKIARCVELAIDVLIDDSPVNLERADEAGILGATIEHPWNREACRRPGIVCAADWPALERALAPHLDRRRHAA